jgi:hypothetical protein
MITRLLQFLTALPGILLLSVGTRWVVTPASMAMDLNMPMMDGVARSSQIGDLGALFSSAGLFILIGVVTSKRTWLYAGAIIVAMVATFRSSAWLLHDAELASQPITVALVSLAVVLALAAKLKFDESRATPAPGENEGQAG